MKMQEKDLLQAKYQLLAVTNNLPNVVVYQYLLSANGKDNAFPFMSLGSLQLFGIEANEIVEDPMKVFAIVHPEDVGMVMAHIQDSQNQLTSYEITHRIIVNDELKWINTKSNPLRLSDGSTLWNGVSIDVTNQKIFDEKLKKSEYHLKALLNASNDITFLLDREFNVVLFNKAAERTVLSLLKKQITVGESILNYAFLGKSESFHNRLKSALLGISIEAEFEMIIPNQQPRWICIQYNPAYDDDRSVIGVSINLEDITLQKQAQYDLQQKERQLTILADRLPMGAIYQRIQNPDGSQRSAYFSAGYSQLTGIAPSELLVDASYRSKLLSKATLDEYNRVEQLAISNSEIFDFEFQITNVLTQKVSWVRSMASYTTLEDGAMALDGIVVDITDRRLAEEKLKISESNLQAIVENTDTAYTLYDKNLQVVSFNRLANFLALDQVAKHLIEGASGLDYFTNNSKEMLVPLFRKVLEGEAASFEENYESIHFYCRLFPVKGIDNEVMGAIMAKTDITFTKEAQRKIDRSQKLYESLVKSQSSFLIRTDLLGNYTFVNPSFLAHFGFEEADLIGTHSFETVHPEDWAACRHAVEECIDQSGKVVKVQFRKPTKMGVFFWTSWEFVTIQNQEGVITEIQCLGYDITETIAHQNELRATTRRLTAAKESAKMGVWELNPTTNSAVWDAEMFLMYGKQQTDTILFSDFEDAILPEDLPYVKRITDNVIKDSSIPFDLTYRIVRENDNAIRFLQSYGMFDTQTNTITGVNFDITERIEREREIAEATKQIEKLQLSALRAAMNPHFIFNALNSIQFFITQNNRESAIDYLSKFSKLVRGILDSSANKKSTIDSELELIKHYVAIEQLRFDTKFDFKLYVDPKIDIDMIELPALLLQPFAENAILHGLYTKQNQGLLEIEVKQNGDFIHITISDNGIGRVAASKLQKSNFPDHTSKGLRITNQRIELLNQRNPIAIAVEDLFENHVPAGTRILISMKKE
jgi:PAS domain S-box-containing protein